MKEKVKVFVNQSNLVIRNIEDLNNIDASNAQEGAILFYNEETEKYEFTNSPDNLIIDSGTF